MTSQEIAQKLSRSFSSVSGQAHLMGLRKTGDLKWGRRVRDRHRQEPGKISYSAVFTRYKTGAKTRNLEFSLTFEQYKEIAIQNCFYCGIAPIKYNVYDTGGGTAVKSARTTHESYGVATIHINGIDRKDNDKGYVVGNVVPCCRVCNRAKLDNSYQEFIEWIEKLIAFRTKA